MSRILTAVLGAAAVIGMAGIAGAQAPARADSAKWARHGQMGAERGARGDHGKFMKALNLTDAQKASMKAIHARYEPQMKAIHEQGKAQLGDMRAARQKGDTSAATRAKFQQFRERAMAVRQQEQNEIRGILTADQRTKFDAAQAQRMQRMEARQKGGRRRRGQFGKAGKA